MARTKKNTNHSSWLAEQLEAPEAQRVFEQERLVVTVTNALTEAMDQQNVSRAYIARKLDRSRAFITQLLAGTRNMTLHTLADLSWALNRRAAFKFCDLARHGYRPLHVSSVEVRPQPQVISLPPSPEPEGAMPARELVDNSEFDIAA